MTTTTLTRNLTTPAKLKPALFYGRYSSDLQRDTSIEDQLRRCREFAAQNDYVISESSVYKDEAISGYKNAVRPGLEALKDAIRSRAYSALFCDEISRLDRKVSRFLTFVEFCEEHGVRILCPDGYDSTSRHAKVMGAMKGAFAEEAMVELAYRIARGQQGALERGYIIGCVPFGYTAKRHYSASGDFVGSTMHIDETKAAIVRSLFALRAQGYSYRQLCTWLHANGVKPRSAATWSPTAVTHVLSNRTYIGYLTYRASRVFRAKGLPPDAKEYYRPELAIVDVDLFNQVQPKVGVLPRRGGGKHWVNGLVRCQRGHLMNTVSKARSHKALTCSKCSADYAAGVLETVSPSIALHYLQDAFTAVLVTLMQDKTALAAFRARAEARLSLDETGRVALLQAEVARYDAALSRLSDTVLSLDEVSAKPFMLKAQQLAEARRQAEARLNAVTASSPVTVEELERQLSAHLPDYVTRLWELPPEKVRFMLSRVFPSVHLVERTVRGSRSSAVLVFKASVAALYSLASSGVQLDEELVTYQVNMEARFHGKRFTDKRCEVSVQRL